MPELHDPDRPRFRCRGLNASELYTLERAHHYAVEMILLASPRGRIATLASRPDVSSAAKALVDALERLDRELEREGRP